MSIRIWSSCVPMLKRHRCCCTILFHDEDFGCVLVNRFTVRRHCLFSPKLPWIGHVVAVVIVCVPLSYSLIFLPMISLLFRVSSVSCWLVIIMYILTGSRVLNVIIAFVPVLETARLEHLGQTSVHTSHSRRFRLRSSSHALSANRLISPHSLSTSSP